MIWIVLYFLAFTANLSLGLWLNEPFNVFISGVSFAACGAAFLEVLRSGA